MLRPAVLASVGLVALSSCSLVFDSQGDGDGGSSSTGRVERDRRVFGNQGANLDRLVVDGVSTLGPNRFLLLEVGWCKNGKAPSPAGVSCGDIDLERIDRQALGDACGIDFWGVHLPEAMDDADCAVEFGEGITDAVAIAMSFTGAEPSLDYFTDGLIDAEPATFDIQGATAGSYVVSGGIGFPPNAPEPTPGAELIRAGVTGEGDVVWAVGMEIHEDPGISELGVLADEAWNANYLLLVEIPPN